MSQLDDILAQHGEDDGCPKSAAFRRELVILIKREQFKRRLLGSARRARGRSAA